MITIRTDRRCRDRRHQPSGRRRSDNTEVIAEGQFCIDDRIKAVFIGAKRYSLSPKEYELLKLLLNNHKRTVSHEEIIQHLWPKNPRASQVDCKQFILLLRKRIEDDYSNPRWLKTVKGFGYRLVVE